MDDIATLNTKIIKSCVALEKNIPKNEIVPKLKERAENFKEKIAALTVLRNPTLRKVSDDFVVLFFSKLDFSFLASLGKNRRSDQQENTFG